MQTTIRFGFEKATKNTFKFAEQPAEGTEPVIGSLYVQKDAFGGKQPTTVVVSLSVEA